MSRLRLSVDTLTGRGKNPGIHERREEARHPGGRRSGPRHQRRHLGRHHRSHQRGLRGGGHPRRLQAPRAPRPLEAVAAHHRRRLARAPDRRLHARHVAREPDQVGGGACARSSRRCSEAGITHLVTIGGDDTALSSRHVAERSRRRHPLRPRAQDDRQRPAAARRTCRPSASRPPATPASSWCATSWRTRAPRGAGTCVVAMGRQAGHLALGIGKAAGATLTVIAEEFAARTVPFARLCDIVEGAIIKRQAMGRAFGVAVLAEGLIDKLDPAELAGAPGRRARRPRARALRRGGPGAQGEGRGAGAAQPARPARDDHGQERGLRAALRRPHPLRRRVLPRPRLRRRPLPGRRRQRSHGQHPGRAAGAHPLRRPARSGHGQDARAAGGHQQRGLPRGPRLHDPPGGRGLRARGLGGPPGRGGPAHAGRVPPALRAPGRGRRQ